MPDPAPDAPSASADGSAHGGLARRLSREAQRVPSVRVVDTDPTHVKLRYAILDRPPWYVTAILGLQHFLVFIGSTVAIIFITFVPAGASREDVARGISTLFFVSGVITLLQTVVGDRLPAVQGGTFAYLQPVATVTALVKARGGWSPRPDGSDPARFAATMREVSGACIVAGAVVAAIALSGLLRVCLRFISPLVIGASIAAVGFTLYTAGVPAMAACWPVSAPMLALVLLFTLYLRRVRVPVWRGTRVPVFEATPVVLALAAVWSGAGIATAAGAWRTAPPDTVKACATSVDLVERAPWFRVPYPGAFGAPTFSAASIVVVLGGAFTSALQSLGDYYLVARCVAAPVPPPAVVERAVFVQGVTSLLAGAFPTGTGSTIYNENAATLIVTRVGARVVIQASAVIAIGVSLLPKLAAALASIPSGLVAGLSTVMFASVAGMGLSMLQFVDMSGGSPRNVIIVGLSIYAGLSTPAFASDPRYAATGGPVVTPSPAFNAIANSLLQSGSVVTLLLSLLLDATAPATPAERGLAAWHARHDDAAAWWRVPGLAAVYGLPFGVSEKVGEARVWAGAWLRSRVTRTKKKRGGGRDDGGAV